MGKNKTIAICGAGIAGVATAYFLAKKKAEVDIVMIDKHQPLSFTTSRSGENFRDYWPQECMADFVGHSIDLMEKLRQEFGPDSFGMTYSGYHFVSHDRKQVIFPNKHSDGHLVSGFEEITDTGFIKKEHPYLDLGIQKLVRIKKAGKMDVHAMGSLLFREAKKLGVQFLKGEITAIEQKKTGFQLNLDAGTIIHAEQVVIAAGPFINHLAGMVGLHFPIENTLQHKFMIPDPKGVIPKNMPFTIYADSQFLEWSADEAASFAADENYKWLLGKFPGGLHIKPESNGIKLGWAFHTKNELPAWETPGFDIFPQIVLKGASRFIPQLKEYEQNIPAPVIQYSGYYTRTRENWPLIGPTAVPGVLVVGTFAGFGTMSACAAGELCANYVFGKKELPSYAPFFHPDRYNNPIILKKIKLLESDGQL